MKNIYNIIERDTIWFDIETTGIDIKTDRIVEICAIKYKKDKSKEILHRYINPQKEVHPKALEIHGHSNEFLKDYPTFEEVADQLYNFFNGCDLGGYNCIGFDIPILFEELSRSKKYLNIFNINVIDSFNLLNKFETRKLNDVYNRFFGKDIESHHTAEADIEATIKVFEKQVEAYGLENKSIKEISTIIRSTSDGELILDLSGWFKKDGSDILYGRGKHKNTPVKDNLDYLEWIVEKSDIENNSRAVGKLLLDRFKKLSNTNG
jgi:DNA polymerase-3 subunit epsilon